MRLNYSGLRSILVAACVVSVEAAAIQYPQQIRRCLKHLQATGEPAAGKILRLGPSIRGRADLAMIRKAAVIWAPTSPRAQTVLLKPMSSSCLSHLREQRRLYVPADEFMLIKMNRDEHAAFTREAEELGSLTATAAGAETSSRTLADHISPGTLLRLNGLNVLVLLERAETVYATGKSAKRSMSYVLAALPERLTPGVVGDEEHTLRIGVDHRFELDGRPVPEPEVIGRATGQMSMTINADTGSNLKVSLSNVTLDGCVGNLSGGLTLELEP